MAQDLASEKTNRKFPQKLAIFGYRSVILIATLILGWIVLLYLNAGLDLQPLTFFMLAGFLILICTFVLLYNHNYKKFFSFLKRKFPSLTPQKILKTCFVLAIIFGLIARLSTLCLMERVQFHGKDSDYGVSWYYADALVDSERDPELFEETYVAFYPHLLGYIATLTAFLGVFGSNYAVVIILNVVFDMLAVVVLYVLLRKWRNRSTACIGAILWLVNPLQILYCAVSMSVVAINAFLVFALLVGYLFFQKLKQTQLDPKFSTKNLFITGVFALLLGFTLSLGNTYRPIFTALLIAFVLTLFLGVLYYGKKLILPAFVSCVMCVIAFVGVSSLASLVYANINPQYSKEVGVGWNVYVGANYDSRGHWTAQDFSILRPKLWGENIDLVDPFDGSTQDNIKPANLAELQDELLEMGLVRYKSMNPLELISHFIHKTVVLFTGDGTTVPTITWPFVKEFAMQDNQPIYQLIHSLGKLLLVFCIILSFIFSGRIFIKSKQAQKAEKDPMVFWVILSFCGLVAASMLVEVMYRYIMPISVFFVVLAICELGGWFDKIKNSRKNIDSSQSRN